MPTPPSNVITAPTGQPPQLPVTTVARVIYTAYRIAGILPDAGTTQNAEELQDGFETLNSMLDAWNAQRLMIYTISRYLFQLVAGQQVYQIGPGAADWDFPRPPRIEVASCVITSEPNYPLEQAIACLTYQQWQTLPSKQTQSPIPQSYYYDQQFPIGNVYFYPVPTAQDSGTNQVALYVWNTIPAFQTTDQQVSFPFAYLKLIQYSLAIELAARFPLRQNLSPIAVKMAAEAMQTVKSLNTAVVISKLDPAVVSSTGALYNYLSDTYVIR